MHFSITLCYVCRESADKLFYCPKTESRALLWLEAIGIDKKHLNEAAGRLKLCQKHFNSSDFTNSLQNRINRNAIPSLFLKIRQSSATVLSLSKTQIPTTTINSNVIDLPVDKLSAAVSSLSNIQTPMVSSNANIILLPVNSQKSVAVPSISKVETPVATINPNVIDLPDNEEDFEQKNMIKRRKFLYQLMISQLFYDGHQNIALSLSAAVQASPPYSPSDRLLHIIAGIEHEPNRKKRLQNHSVGDNNLATGLDLKPIIESQVQDGKSTADLERKQNFIQSNNSGDSIVSVGINLEFGTRSGVPAPEPALYKTVYVNSHEGNCRIGCFSRDGQLIATGSVDTTIKILDVKRVFVKSACDEIESNRETIGHPIIRKLCDHEAEVTALEFHPKEPVLASGSRDFTVKLFNISKPSENNVFKTLKDVLPIRCLTFHPAGEHLLVGASHPLVRLYDLNTAQCYISSLPSQHTDIINSIKYSQNAKYYATASKDGSIKLWDGVSNMCIHTFTKPHNGDEVCSVTFTQNGRYLLSSGKDSLVRLWELRSKRCLFTYTGARTTAGRQVHKAQAVFNHTEDYILFPDKASTSLCVWNSRKSFRKQLMFLGHNALVRMLVHSPTQAAFLTCSDDFSARLWFR